MCLLLAALGMPIYCLLDNIPMIEMPKFIGCLFAGANARNVMLQHQVLCSEVDAIEYMSGFYLALVLKTPDFTKLARLQPDGHHPRSTGDPHAALFGNSAPSTSLPTTAHSYDKQATSVGLHHPNA